MATKKPSRLRIVPLANVKSGVGKSTLCSALPAQAAQNRKRVALLDLDPQESLASWRRRLSDGESFRATARSYRCSHSPISRLACT